MEVDDNDASFTRAVDGWGAGSHVCEVAQYNTNTHVTRQNHVGRGICTRRRGGRGRPVALYFDGGTFFVGCLRIFFLLLLLLLHFFVTIVTNVCVCVCMCV